MKPRLAAIAALGLALAVYLVVTAGAGPVVSAAAAVGWQGFAILCLYATGLFILLGTAWYVIVPAPAHAPLRVLIWARMVRDAASEVLPFSHVGGLVLGARAATSNGVSKPLVIASMIVDVTTETLAQVIYAAAGVAIFSRYTPSGAMPASTTAMLAVCVGLTAAAGVLLLALRRYGRQLINKLAARFFPDALAATASVAHTLEIIYRGRARLGLGVSLHLAGWITSAVGVWIAFRLMSVRIDLLAVLAIESLVYAARSAAALVPNALGVQEAAYAVLCPYFGVGAEVGLGVSLLKRARDIAVGVPIMLVWQSLEGHRLFRRRGS
ncbi:MAG: lysylphosphatidylglycerol synthase domain-containing protein [Gammaproteobacteria bacterium]